MDKKTRELLAKLFTSQLEQLAKDKDIDCGQDPDRIDYLSILGKSDEISKEDVERFIGETEVETKEPDVGEEYFVEVEKILKDFRKRNSIFDAANELLQKMQTNFGEGNLEDTISEGIATPGMSEDISKNFEKVRKAFVIYAFRQLIGDVRDSGIDVGEARDLAQKAAEHLHNAEMNELDTILDDISTTANHLTKEQAKKMKELISTVEEFIVQTRDLGANVKDAKELFDKAEEAYDSKIFKKVSYFATKARKASEDARADRIRGISDSLIFVRTILNDARDIGANVGEAEEIYTEADLAFKMENYKECKVLIKEVEQLALQLQDDQIKKALNLKKRREPDEEAKGEDVVEVEAEIVSPPQRRFMRATPSPYSQTFPRTPMSPPRRPPPSGVRKTRCPNCGESFPIRGGKGPQRIECPSCGMRGMMP